MYGQFLGRDFNPLDSLLLLRTVKPSLSAPFAHHPLLRAPVGLLFFCLLCPFCVAFQPAEMDKVAVPQRPLPHQRARPSDVGRMVRFSGKSLSLSVTWRRQAESDKAVRIAQGTEGVVGSKRYSSERYLQEIMIYC